MITYSSVAMHCVPRRWCRLCVGGPKPLPPPPTLLWRDDGRNSSGRTASVWQADAQCHTMMVLEGTDVAKAQQVSHVNRH